jgi:pimeloyl-ACP methyl ester carboxylesterase
MANVVLLHGFPLSGAMWTDQAHALASQGHRVLVTDLPGFGGTAPPEVNPDLAVMAQWVESQMGLLEMDSAVIAGLSMGGYVAMEMLRRSPHLVAALVLCDTKASADSDAARADRERIASSVLQSGSTDVLARSMPESLLGESTRRSNVDIARTVRQWIAAADPRGVAWAQRAMAERPDSLDTLRAVQVPALIIWGEEDTVSPWEEQQAMLDVMEGARLERIRSAGHLSPVEQPSMVSRALVDFVSAVG